MTPDEREALLEQLWRAHAPAVVRYARRRVLPAEVDEVVAETFLVAWRRLDDVPDYPLPWLLGVARGVSANVRRAARRQDAVSVRLGTLPPSQGQEVMHVEGLSEQLHRLLSALSADDRELLTLLAWDGLDRQEAATALGISRATLAVRLHRLRRRAKDALHEPPDGTTAPPPSGPRSHTLERTTTP